MSKTTNEVIERLNDEQAETFFAKPILPGLADLNPADIVKPILDGYKSAITGLEEIYHFAKILDQAKKMIEDDAVEEAENYNKFETLPSILGYKIIKKSGRRSFKFEDLSIKTAEQRVKELKECAKNGTPTADGEILDRPLETFAKDYLAFSKIK